MLDEVRSKHPTTPLTAAAENRIKYPLLRLKVDTTGFSTINPQKFGARFVDRVANPGSMLKFHTKPRRRVDADGGKKERKGAAGAAGDDVANKNVPGQIKELVADFLDGSTKDKLVLLPQSVLDACVFEGFVGKEEKDSISKGVEAWLKSTQKDLAIQAQQANFDQRGDRKEQEKLLERLARERSEAQDREAADGADKGAASGASGPSGPSGAAAASGGGGVGMDDDDFGDDLEGAPAAPGRTGGQLSDDMDDDDDDDEAGERARAKGKAAAGKSAAAASKPAARAKAPAARAGGGRGSRGGRGARAGGGTRGRQTTLNVSRGRGAASGAETVDLLDSDEEQHLTIGDDLPTKARGKRAAPTASSAAAGRSKRAREVKTYKGDSDDDDGDGDDGSDYVEEVEEPPRSAHSSNFSSRRRAR